MLISFLFSLIFEYLFLVNFKFLIFIFVFVFLTTKYFYLPIIVLILFFIFLLFYNPRYCFFGIIGFFIAIIEISFFYPIFMVFKDYPVIFYGLINKEVYFLTIFLISFLFIFIKTTKNKNHLILTKIFALFIVSFFLFIGFYNYFSEKNSEKNYELLEGKEFYLVIKPINFKKECLIWSYEFKLNKINSNYLNLSNNTLKCTSYKNLNKTKNNKFVIKIDSEKCYVIK